MVQLTDYARLYRDLSRSTFENAQSCLTHFLATGDTWWLAQYYESLEVASGYADLYNQEMAL